MERDPETGVQHRVSFGEAFKVWFKVALYSFGGPAGQISVMHRLLVDEKRWISETRFLHALNYCMLLPGPEAQQLATYIGWLLHRVRGGLMAGTLFVLPGFLSILGLSLLYASYQDVVFVQAFFDGLKPAVVAVVAGAAVRIGSRVLRNRTTVLIAAGAFVAIFFFDILFPFIILGAALIGLAGERFRPGPFQLASAHGPHPGGQEQIESQTAISDQVTAVRPSARRAAGVVLVWGSLWILPLLGLYLADINPVYLTEGVFFSKMAMVTFGGAYAVLAYVAQEAVNTHAWLQPQEMLDGLGMAETTPGPLIQVVQFVGFMGAYRSPGQLDPALAGVAASVLTTWVTFVPCFLWIFLGAPYVEYLRGNRRLSSALSTITAAVVGVILNLALWFAVHTIFVQVDEVRLYGIRLLVPAGIDPAALAIALAALAAILYFRVGMIKTLTAGALAGLLYRLFL